MNEAPALPAGPRPFRRWLTVLGTLVVAATLVGGYAVNGRTAIDGGEADPLATFDSLIRHEPLDEPLAAPVAADAERALRAVLSDRRAARLAVRGARARLAVVLGERGRWAEARPLLAADEGTVFPRVVSCAYGDHQDCATVAVCDAARASALAAYAGDWCAARACVVAAGRTGDLPAARGLAQLPARFPRLGALRVALEVALLVAGLLAAGSIFRRRHAARPPRPDLPTPWSPGQLYAALVRCLLWSLLITIPLFLGLDQIARAPSLETLVAILYLAGCWWLARLVFRRWGLSWRDSLSWPREREIGSTMLAAMALLRAGQTGVGAVAAALHHHTPWADAPPPIDPTAYGRLAMSLLGMVVLAPLVEELTFRRAILARLARTHSAGFAIVTSTIVFTLPHGYSPIGLLAIFWTGLVLAWAFYRTGNLWPGLVAHAYGNAMALWWSLT